MPAAKVKGGKGNSILGETSQRNWLNHKHFQKKHTGSHTPSAGSESVFILKTEFGRKESRDCIKVPNVASGRQCFHVNDELFFSTCPDRLLRRTAGHSGGRKHCLFQSALHSQKLAWICSGVTNKIGLADLD